MQYSAVNLSQALPRRWLIVLIRPLVGPFGLSRWWVVLLGLLGVFVALLVLQLGAAAVWLGLGVVPRGRTARQWPWRLGIGLLTYGVIWQFVAPVVGEQYDRVALPCFGETLRAHSAVYCLANRHYVRSELAESASRIAERVARDHPGTVVRYLDGGFPMGSGFPLLPHISHGDGRRLDLALMWQDSTGSAARGNGSPLGYFGYASPPVDAPADCPVAVVDLRWDMNSLQPVLSRNDLDVVRTRSLLDAVLAEQAIGKVLLEPHVQRQLERVSERLRFQGCHAARHDDHMHIQL